MDFMAEKRRYQRCSSLVGKVAISFNELEWKDVELVDVSAGGICFASHNPIGASNKMFVHFNVYNMLSEFSLSFEASIVRFNKHGGIYEYAVKFENVDKYIQIQLDELVKSKICIKNREIPILHEDLSYKILFVPRGKTRRIRM